MIDNYKQIRAEEKLLLKLCRLNFNETDALQLKDLAISVTDWSYFTKLANMHGVSSIAYYNINALQISPFVPNNALLYLMQCFYKSMARNAANTWLLSQILYSFSRAQIKTVLLKGMDLELTVYGNKGLRQMSDVDVLLDKNDCVKARNILLECGYSSAPIKSPFYKHIYLESGKHLPTMIKGDFSIEIHNDLYKTTRNNTTEEYYNNASLLKVSGEKAWVGSPQEKFIFLLKHLTGHEIQNESQLRLYTDLVVLIEKYQQEIINPQLIKKATEAGILEIMSSRLIPLREFWDIRFPEYINDVIDTFGKPEFIDKFIFFLKEPKNNPRNQAKLYRYHIGQIHGFHKKVLFVLGDIFPSIEFMRNRYECDTFAALLHYPHRFGKLFFLIGSYKKEHELV